MAPCDPIAYNHPGVERAMGRGREDEVQAVDKETARVRCIAHLLTQMPYKEVVKLPIDLPARVRKPEYTRQPVASKVFVPERFSVSPGEPGKAAGQRPSRGRPGRRRLKRSAAISVPCAVSE